MHSRYYANDPKLLFIYFLRSTLIKRPLPIIHNIMKNIFNFFFFLVHSTHSRSKKQQSRLLRRWKNTILLKYTSCQRNVKYLWIQFFFISSLWYTVGTVLLLKINTEISHEETEVSLLQKYLSAQHSPTIFDFYILLWCDMFVDV